VTAMRRPADAGDRVLGRQPKIVYEPATVAEAVAAVAEAAADDRALVFVGGGTDLGAGAPPERLDAALATRNLSRVVEHAPSDQIVVVEAGCTLAALAAALAAHGQRLALDPPRPDRATVGGVVAANAYGPRRMRFGSVRDLLIGASFVRADGVLARTGSKVVKNVAGFDVPKLLVGSMGTLGLIATATFRLHPLPEEESTMLSTGLGAAAVRAFLSEARRAQLEPTSVVALWQGEDRFDLAVRFEGFRAGLTEQRDRLARLPCESGSFERLGPEESRDFWSRHDALRCELPVRARLAARATDLETIAARVLPPLSAAFEEPAFLAYPTLGLSFFAGRPAEAKSGARALAAARAEVEKLGGSLTLAAATEAIRDLIDVWGTPPPALPLMRNVKQRLDPRRILAPGRFVGGI